MRKVDSNKEVYVIEDIKFDYEPPEKCSVGGSMVITVSFVDHVTVRHAISCGSHPAIGQKRCFDYLFALINGEVKDQDNKPWIVKRKSCDTVPDEVAA